MQTLRAGVFCLCEGLRFFFAADKRAANDVGRFKDDLGEQGRPVGAEVVRVVEGPGA
jgi:hypothetical protein